MSASAPTRADALWRPRHPWPRVPCRQPQSGVAGENARADAAASGEQLGERRGLPARGPVLVDHLGADALGEVGLGRREPEDEPVLLRERGAQVGQLARAADRREGDGERGRRQLAPAGRQWRMPRARGAHAGARRSRPPCRPRRRRRSTRAPRRSRDARRRLVEEQHELRRTARVCAGLERVAQPLEVLGGDEVVGEAGVDRIRGVHDRRR